MSIAPPHSEMAERRWNSRRLLVLRGKSRATSVHAAPEPAQVIQLTSAMETRGGHEVARVARSDMVRRVVSSHLPCGIIVGGVVAPMTPWPSTSATANPRIPAGAFDCIHGTHTLA